MSLVADFFFFHGFPSTKRIRAALKERITFLHYWLVCHIAQPHFDRTFGTEKVSGLSLSFMDIFVMEFIVFIPVV